MKFAIPSSFQLAGRTWTVKRVGKRKWYGQTNSTKCTIKLSTLNKDDEEYRHTFLHELLHACSYAMAWTSFNNNEARIDGLANLLLQVLTTGE